MAKTKVKINSHTVHAGTVHKPETVLELEDAHAESLIARGLACAVEKEETKKGKKFEAE